MKGLELGQPGERSKLFPAREYMRRGHHVSRHNLATPPDLDMRAEMSVQRAYAYLCVSVDGEEENVGCIIRTSRP